MSPPTCETCRFMNPKGYDGFPECRRFPPQTGGQNMAVGRTFVWRAPTFFRVNRDTWCGEHHPIPPLPGSDWASTGGADTPNSCDKQS